MSLSPATVTLNKIMIESTAKTMASRARVFDRFFSGSYGGCPFRSRYRTVKIIMAAITTANATSAIMAAKLKKWFQSTALGGIVSDINLLHPSSAGKQKRRGFLYVKIKPLQYQHRVKCEGPLTTVSLSMGLPLLDPTFRVTHVNRFGRYSSNFLRCLL